MKSLKTILSILSLLIIITGCQSIAKVPEYSIGIKNGTDSSIGLADVCFGNFSTGGGYLRPGDTKTYEFVPCPIPEQVTVFWQNQDGKEQKQTVAVFQNLPKNFNQGDIIFTISDNENVSVTTRPYLKLLK